MLESGQSAKGRHGAKRVFRPCWHSCLEIILDAEQEHGSCLEMGGFSSYLRQMALAFRD